MTKRCRQAPYRTEFIIAVSSVRFYISSHCATLPPIPNLTGSRHWPGPMLISGAPGAAKADCAPWHRSRPPLLTSRRRRGRQRSVQNCLCFPLNLRPQVIQLLAFICRQKQWLFCRRIPATARIVTVVCQRETALCASIWCPRSGPALKRGKWCLQQVVVSARGPGLKGREANSRPPPPRLITKERSTGLQGRICSLGERK
jgi:hypothetical protein